MAKKTKDKLMLDQTKEDKIEEKKKKASTEMYLHCHGHATVALSKLHGSGFDNVAAFEQLSRSVDRVRKNDRHEIEAMLMTQAKSLEYVFYNALSKLPAASIEHAEVFASIALKAQTGCRKTLMALVELKHPRRATTIIRQQNNAITQQVNNKITSEPCEIEKNKKIANELNAKVSYETKNMDDGTTFTTGTTHTPTEAMDLLYRS